MKILYINHYAGTFELGMEFRPLYLSREWVKQGHQVLIVASSESHVRAKNPVLNEPELRETHDGVEYLWLKTRKYQGNGIGRVLNIVSFLKKLWWKAPELAKTFQPDIVIASSTYPMDIWPAQRIAQKAKARLVFEVHDLWPLSPIELGGMSPKHPFIRWVQLAEDKAYRVSDVVISMLPKALPYMQSRGLDPQKFHSVPNGIDLNEWKNDSKPVPDSLQSKFDELKAQKKFLVGYAGAHGLANGLEALLEAAQILQGKPYQIVLIGSGPDKAKLEKKARDMALSNVSFFDPVPKKCVPNALAQLDAVYIGLQKQSLFRFGISPNKMIDYMAAGKPIINAVEAGNDPVKECGCGFSIPAQDPKALAEAIEKMANLSSEERARMGAKGRAFVEAHHDYPALAKKFLDSCLSK